MLVEGLSSRATSPSSNRQALETSVSADVPTTSIASLRLSSNTKDLAEYEPLIDNLLTLASTKVFQRTKFKIGDIESEYSPYWNWLDCEREYERRPTELVGKCIVCGKVKKEPFAKPGNFKKHLMSANHTRVHKWIQSYEQQTDTPTILNKLDRTTLNLIKFFINSDVAISALRDSHLRQVMTVKLDKFAFTKRILPDAMQ